MDRVFLKLGPINIYWYSVLIVVAVAIGLYFAPKEAEKKGLGKDYIIDMVFYLIPIAIIGARLYYIIFNYNAFKGDFLSIFKIWEGGLAIYGAVIASVIFIYFYAKKKEKNFLMTLDILAPYLILGQSIGRWGNFINQEAHGAVTTLSHLESLHLPSFIIKGMYINEHYYIPTFLYESLWCLLGFIILFIIKKKDNYNHKGIILFSYMIWYGIGRFIIEGMRTDSLYLGTFRVSQIVSILIIIIGLVGVIYTFIGRRKNKNAKI